MSIEEGGRVGVWRRCCAQPSDYRVGAIEREGFRREALLFLAGKQDGACVTQHAVVCPGPVEPLFRMLEREAALEPRIEHPMGKDVIGRGGAAKCAPCAEAVVLPETIDDDCVVAGMVLAHPGHEGGGKGIGAAGGTEGVQVQGKVADFGVCGIIKGY